MEPQVKTHTSAKDFFINLGSMVALYTVIIALLNLLFTIINKAFPLITNGYNYYGTSSISFPVATLIIFFPVYVLLMWIMEKEYRTEPEKKNLGIRKWLTYITLFIAGLVLAADLVYVMYYFIDGQELTAGFLLKALSVLVVVFCVFWYYLSDIRNMLTPTKRKMWAGIMLVIIVASIGWGFAVLGSPRTQQLIKYDEQKIYDLQNIQSQVQSYYQSKGVLPATMEQLTLEYSYLPKDSQVGKTYEYVLTEQSKRTYQLCAEFNKMSDETGKGGMASPVYPYGGQEISWNHPVGRHCYTLSIPEYMIIKK